MAPTLGLHQGTRTRRTTGVQSVRSPPGSESPGESGHRYHSIRVRWSDGPPYAGGWGEYLDEKEEGDTWPSSRSPVEALFSRVLRLTRRGPQVLIPRHRGRRLDPPGVHVPTSLSGSQSRASDTCRVSGLGPRTLGGTSGVRLERVRSRLL